jgi:hypothetical protein
MPILYFLKEYIANPSIYQERKANMKMEYENIKPPVNAKKINESVKSKITQIWISTEYAIEMNKATIEKYYQEELLNKGWKYERTDHDGVVYFKKNDLLFSVKAANNTVYTGIYYDGPGPGI